MAPHEFFATIAADDVSFCLEEKRLTYICIVNGAAIGGALRDGAYGFHEEVSAFGANY